MPLQREIDYWEEQSKDKVSGNQLLKDNTHKRPHQLQRLLEYNWIGENVLEIGHGNAMIAGALKVAVAGHWDYIGTELSPSFKEHAEKAFGLESVQFDIREIGPNFPYEHKKSDDKYTRIIAFDSFEHVRPEHREEGYRRVAQVAAEDALLFIHYSDSPCSHDPEFDHPFGLEDLVQLQSVGFSLNRFERYRCESMKVTLNHVFVVMKKCG